MRRNFVRSRPSTRQAHASRPRQQKVAAERLAPADLTPHSGLRPTSTGALSHQAFTALYLPRGEVALNKIQMVSKSTGASKRLFLAKFDNAVKYLNHRIRVSLDVSALGPKRTRRLALIEAFGGR